MQPKDTNSNPDPATEPDATTDPAQPEAAQGGLPFPPPSLALIDSLLLARLPEDVRADLRKHRGYTALMDLEHMNPEHLLPTLRGQLGIGAGEDPTGVAEFIGLVDQAFTQAATSQPENIAPTAEEVAPLTNDLEDLRMVLDRPETADVLRAMGLSEADMNALRSAPEETLRALKEQLAGIGQPPRADATKLAKVEMPNPFDGRSAALVFTAGPVQALIDALQSPSRFIPTRYGRPVHAHATRNTKIDTVLKHPAPRNTPAYNEPPIDMMPLSESETQQLWSYVRDMNDLGADVLLMLMMQSLYNGNQDLAAWVRADGLLDYRGIKPITKYESGRPRDAGNREEDLEDVAGSMHTLDSLWLRIRALKIVEAIPGKRPKKIDYSTKYIQYSKAIAITDVVTRKRERKPDLPIAWRYVLGEWAKAFLISGNEQLGVFMQKALHYDPHNELWPKRIARYIFFHFRMDAKHGRPLKRQIGPLLEALNLPIDRRNPIRTRDTLERALRRLYKDEVIGAPYYAAAGGEEQIPRADGEMGPKPLTDRLPPRGWLEDYLGWNVVLPPSVLLMGAYDDLSARARKQLARTIVKAGAVGEPRGTGEKQQGQR